MKGKPTSGALVMAASWEAAPPAPVWFGGGWVFLMQPRVSRRPLHVYTKKYLSLFFSSMTVLYDCLYCELMWNSSLVINKAQTGDGFVAG